MGDESSLAVSGLEITRGMVSVVVVNYRGADDTIACLKTFDDVDWPKDRLELIVVENASGADQAERIRTALPHVRLVVSETNTGFAGGCNLGVKHARGEYVGFINNDARPHRDWIRAAAETMAEDSTIGSIASKVLDWDGSRIDYVDGSLTWYGMGYKREVGRPDSPEFDQAKDVLFGTGAAMFVRTDVYREIGGFDERFFMFYEDVDLGWRMNLLGYRVRYEPRSIAYHRHHASIDKFGNFRESYLLERNALLTMYKNYGDEALARTLPAALALTVRRGFARGDVDTSLLDLQRSPGHDDVAVLSLPKQGLTGAFAVDYFVECMPTLAPDRQEIQRRRRRSDAELFPLFRQAMEPAYPFASYVAAHDQLAEAFNIESLFSSRHRILIVTGEPLAARMAGPAIRAWEMAKALSTEHDVRLLSTTGSKLSHPDFEVGYGARGEMRGHAEWAEVIVFQGFLLQSYPWLVESNKIIIPDIYDPIHLEQLEQAKDRGPEGRAESVAECTEALNEQLSRGDFFLCASEKQRDFWLGQLAALGRVNPWTYDHDESLMSLISVVPFGIEDTAPRLKRHAIKGVIDGIGEDDKVVLWGGGIYNWFDPITLIRAIARLVERRSNVRLVFMGLKHPNPGVPQMRMAVRAQELSEQLGLTDKVVFFNQGWVPYEDRANFLLDADVGVSTHLDHVETAFSFRTRILDYLWAGLPIVATGGDTFDAIIQEHGLGKTVPAGDVDALADALEVMLYDQAAAAAARASIAAYSTQYRWSNVLQPLIEFCRTPHRAADLQGDEPVTTEGASGRSYRARRRRPTMAENVQLAKDYFAAGGLREVSRRAAGRVRHTVQRRA